MDLSALGSTLPPGLADAEREMGDKFRGGFPIFDMNHVTVGGEVGATAPMPDRRTWAYQVVQEVVADIAS